MNDRVLVIAGPTASGKTDASIKIAEKISAEIISCDSMQVYKGMRIISQAPSAAQLKAVKHYLIGFVPPDREYSAAKFSEEAAACIKDILARNKTPIITGGTGLYIKALVDGLFKAPEGDKDFRDSLEMAADLNGVPYLHAELKKIDPDSADTIHRNDKKRIIRALEIYHLTGTPKSVHIKNTRGIKDEYKIIFAGIDIPRADLYRRIDERAGKMFGSGAIDEVRALLARDLSLTAKTALGIQEIKGYIEGQYGIDEAKDILKKNTRNYAKRQMTWFRRNERIKWFKDGESLISYCVSLFEKR